MVKRPKDNRAGSDGSARDPLLKQDIQHKTDSFARMVRGLMMESYLVEGAQPVDGGVFGQSITDPCLGWDDTVAFVHRLAEAV